MEWFECADAFCHREPDRSLALGGSGPLICFRCLGHYAGFLVAACIPFFPPVGVGRGTKTAPAVISLLISASFAEKAVEWLGGWDGSNAIRLVAGLATGGGFALLAVWVTRRRCRWTMSMASVVAAAALSLTFYPPLLAPILLACCILCLLSMSYRSKNEGHLDAI